MGRLINRPCIYDSYYPCDFGCNNTNCEFYTDENEEDEEQGYSDEEGRYYLNEE